MVLCKMCNLPNISTIRDMVEIFALIVGGVAAIRGMSFLSELKKKRSAAVFTYWTQLGYRLKEIEKRLKQENGLINNLYSPEARKNWTPEYSTPDSEAIVEFKEIAQDCYSFIKAAPDQIPVADGWTNAMNQITTFLDDIQCYDICDSKKHFMVKEEQIPHVRDDYCKSILNNIQCVITMIEAEQKEAEKRLVGKS